MVPLPDEPMLKPPGLALSSACISLAFLAGTLAGLTTSTKGDPPTTLMGVMSFRLS